VEGRVLCRLHGAGGCQLTGPRRFNAGRLGFYVGIHGGGGCQLTGPRRFNAEVRLTAISLPAGTRNCTAAFGSSLVFVSVSGGACSGWMGGPRLCDRFGSYRNDERRGSSSWHRRS
jgi:hypothetical protein